MTRVGSGLASDLVPHRRQTQSALEQDLCGHRALFAQKTQQQMFSPNVPVLQAVGFFMRVMKNPLGFWSQWQLDGSWNPFAQQGTAFDLSPDGFNCDLRSREEAAGQGLVFSH